MDARISIVLWLMMPFMPEAGMVIGKVLEESDRSDAAKVSFLSDAEKVTTINGSPCQERDFSKAAKASALSDAEQAEPGLHGIKNSGNVCYLISILQALAHLRAMWRNVLAFTCASPKKKLSFEYGKFQEALWSTDLRLPPDPADLAKLLGLQPKVQQDAQEALHGLLDGLMEEQGGWFQEAFQVATSSSVKCASCHHGAEEVIEPFTRIVVPVWESHTQLQDGLNQWAAPDVIQDSRCTLCGEAKSQTTRLSMLPEVLILQLARFAYCKDMGVQKKERAIQLPLALDVDPWMARGCEGARYSLASVVSHHGPVPDAGHYSSTVLVDTNWYTFNDDVVTRTEAPTHGDEAYILFYVREPAQVSLSPEKEKPRMLEYDQDACRQRAERQQRLFEEQLKVAVERQRERGEDMRMRTEENLQRWHERAAQRLLECAEDERMSREERQQRYVAALRDADAKLSRILEELLLEREEAHERYTMPQKTGEFVLKQLEEDAQRRRDSHLAIQPAMDNCLQGFNEHLAQVDEIYDACFAQFQKDVGAQPDMGRSPRSVVAAELRRDGEALGVDIGKEMRSEEVPPDKSEQETGEKAPDEPKTCEVPKRKRRKGMEEKDRDEEPPKALAKTKGASTAKAAPKALVKKAAAKKAKAKPKAQAKPKAKTVLPQVCRCGQRSAPDSQFCTACGQSLQKRGANQEPLGVPNQKRQKKNTKLTTWRCEYKHGVDIRAGPDINESRVPHALEPGEEFLVEREEAGVDGVLYLKLADGRGWVFDQKPNWGVICAPCKGGRKVSVTVSTLKPEKAKPNQRKAKAKEKAERPCSERSERSRSQKKAETPKQRRSSSSQRRSTGRDDKVEKTSGPGSTRRSRSRPVEDLATPTASPAEPRGRSPTPRGEVGKDVAPRGNQKKSQEAKLRRARDVDDDLKGKETPRTPQKSAPATPARSGSLMSMLRSSPVPKIDVPRTSPRRSMEESPVPTGLVAAATAVSRFNEVPAPDVPPPKIDKQLATPPKEPASRRRARSTAPQAAAQAEEHRSSLPSSLIPAHVRAMLAKPRSRSLEPIVSALPVPAVPKELVEISSEESIKEEDPGFDYELRQFRQRQEMERSAKSAWQAAQRLAEEAEKQRSEMREKTTAAERRSIEVESALQQLRQAVAQVEQRAADRAVKLQQQREAAEAKAQQNEADLKEDSRKIELLHEEGAKRLELLEEELAEKLKDEEIPLISAEEAFKEQLARTKSKIQGKVLQLERKASAERRAVESEAVAQRAVAPQLAALKSEVLATERGATEAEETRKRAEQRAASEEARLDAFLKRLPQLEVEASQKGENMVQEAQEKALRDVAEAKAALRRCVEEASRRMLAAKQSIERTRTTTQKEIERHLDAAHAADAQVLQAMEEEKGSEERAEKLLAVAERDAPGLHALTKRFEVEQQRCQVVKRCRVMENQLAENLKQLKEDHAQQVSAAACASETAALRSQEKVEAAQLELERHRKELQRKKEEAEVKVTEMDQKAQATGIWSQEVRSKCIRILQIAREKLAEQQEATKQEEELEEERAKDRMESTTQMLKEREIWAVVAEDDCAARTAQAKAEAQEAAEQAARRARWAREAEEAAQRMAMAEMDATGREMEETCETLWLQTDEMRKTCQQQQREAAESVGEVRSAVSQALAAARARLASIQSCAAGAAKDVKRAQREEQRAAETLEEREIDFISAVDELEKTELQKTCSVSRCEELLMAAEQSCAQQLGAAWDEAERAKVQEEDRASRAEELAETLEGQALCAEEVAASEKSSQVQRFQREEQRIRTAVREASHRTVNVQEAIHEAIHYSQKSLDELYSYLYSMGQNSAVTPSPSQKGKGCPKCNVIYTPTSSYCQHCGEKLERQPPASCSPLRPPRIRKICSRSYGRVRKSRSPGLSFPRKA